MERICAHLVYVLYHAYMALPVNILLVLAANHFAVISIYPLHRVELQIRIATVSIAF